ncbi:MAG: HzsA-related protein, partial [Planctomycetota bacterium]
QLTRLTPDTPFPEAEAKPIRDYMKYGTAWPLSEDDYLCVYDSEARNRGIYWIDRFGNRELIYRDSSISCLSPIPLRPRPRPPIIPSKTVQTAEAIRRTGGKIPQETITIVNIYDSDFVWPEGTKVAALRIIQALPKTTPPPNKPRIGIATQTNARAVLGTVPVEADGSAYFEAPVGKAIYFQALDAGGMAIQSMRSATYVHPGEQLSCLGCHEPKHRVPKQPTRRPLALKRPPSKIQPDVDGSNPFNYVRLVQPVLERNCVTCHQQQQVLDFDLTGEIEGDNGWTRSYHNLAEKYGFYFHVSNGSINQGVHGGSRTIPGKFGAKAS